MRGFSTNISLLFASPHSNTRQYYDIGCRRHGICDHGSMSTLITKLFRKNRILIICPLSQIVLSAVTSVFLIQYNTIQYNTIQYNTTSFISNREHNYTTTAIFNQYWDGWKGGGQKNNIIVVHPLSGSNLVGRCIRSPYTSLPNFISISFIVNKIWLLASFIYGAITVWPMRGFSTNISRL